MAKETYYFSHDYNPIGDPKMQAMLSEHGGLGYGIFWRIVEMLHSEADHCLPLKKFVYIGIAKQMKTTPEFVEDFITDCIENFELFLKQTKQNEGGSFFSSNRVFRNVENRSETKRRFVESGRVGGIKSGESRRKKALTKRNEASLQKNEANEAKERKRKENIYTIYPTKDFLIELPDFEINKAVEYLTLTKHTPVTREMVISIWETFKIKNFTGAKSYKDSRDIISHFFESLKFQPINGTTTHQQPIAGSNKQGTSTARIDALKKW